MSGAAGRSFRGVKLNLRQMISECGGVPAAAERIGIRPSTIRKVLARRPVALATLKKVKARLRGSDSSSINHEQSDRLKLVARIYQRCHTLQETGIELGLSRERVRQLLEKGAELGLLRYAPRALPEISKDKLIALYGVLGSFHKVAAKLKVSIHALHKIVKKHEIKEDEFSHARQGEKRRACIDEFKKVTERLGHYPTATELQQIPGRLLYIRIARHWGSLDNFRAELNIPKPVLGNPNFREDVSKGLERRRRLAQIARIQWLDDIRGQLSANGAMSLREIAHACNFKLPRAALLVNLLISSGEVSKEGSRISRRYKLISGAI